VKRMAWRSRRTPTPSPAPEAASPHPINTRALQAAEQLCSPVALGRARLQPYRYRLEGRVARSSVLVSSPITRLWVPRPCVLCKGGTRCRRCDMRPSHCVNIPTPTLRKVREGWGTPRASVPARSKAWATRLENCHPERSEGSAVDRETKTTREGAIPPAVSCAENSCRDGACPVSDCRTTLAHLGFGKGTASAVPPIANKHEGFSP